MGSLAELADLAAARGQKIELLYTFIYRRAWEATANPLDRARWGSGYLQQVIKLAPEDAAEVERAGVALTDDMLSQPEALAAYERSLQRLRTLLKRPAFTLAALLTIAVGIHLERIQPGQVLVHERLDHVLRERPLEVHDVVREAERVRDAAGQLRELPVLVCGGAACQTRRDEPRNQTYHF